VLAAAVAQMARLMTGLASVGTLMMLALVSCDVLSRLLFNIAIPGTETIVASYLMVAIIFLPLAMLQLQEENISVEVIANLVPVPLQLVFDLVGHLLTAIFYGLLAYLYYHVAVEAIEIREFVSGTWNVPIWPARLIMPFGLFVGVIAAVTKGIVVLGKLASGSSKGPHKHSEGPQA